MKNVFSIIILLFLLMSPGLALMFFQAEEPKQNVLGESTQERPSRRANPKFTCGLPFLRDNGCPCKTDFVCKSSMCEDRRCSGSSEEPQDPNEDNDEDNDTEQLRCDFDRDGQLTVSDYNLLVTELQTNPDTLLADCNGNGEIDVIDYVLWLQEFTSLAGSD